MKNSEKLKKFKTYIPYIFAILTSIIIYGFALTNFSVVPDTESPIYPDYSLSLGRWGTNLIRYHIFNGLLPYYTLLFGLFFLSLTSVEITKLLHIKGLYRYIFILLFLSFPQHAYQLVFTMQADAIPIGYFSSTIAVMLFINIKSLKNIQSFVKLILSTFLIVFSIAIYQALIVIPVILYALYFFNKINSNQIDLNNEWKKLFGFIGVLTTSAIIYIVSVKLFFPTTESGYLASYLSGEGSSRIRDFILLLKSNLLGDFYYGNKPFLLATLGGIIAIIYFLYKRKHIWLNILTIVFLFIFPFSISFFITNGTHPPRLYVGSTLVFAFILVYIIKKTRFLDDKYLLFTTMLIFLWNTYYITNLFVASNRIFHYDLETAKNINNYINEHIENFNSAEDYVYFYGTTPLKDYEKMILPKSDVFSGSLFRWDGGNNWRIINFFSFNNVSNYRYLEDQTVIEKLEPIIKDMNLYPQKESIKKIGNIVVVKLGHNTNKPFIQNTPEFNPNDTTSITKLHKLIFENKKIEGGIDNFKQKNDSVYIEGWVAYKNVPSINTNASILLFNDKDTFEIETKTITRFDVTEYLGDRTNYNSSGFKSVFDVSSLVRGSYDVGIRLTNTQTNEDAYKYGYKKVIVD